MSLLKRRRLGAWVLLLAALTGAIISLYVYITPLTGVTGTLGALVAILACLVLMAAALLLFKVKGGGLIALRVLVVIGLAGTFFAAMLLHQWWLGVAMVIGLIGLVSDIAMSPSSSKPTRI